MKMTDVPEIARPWSIRADTEYVETFRNLDDLSGHFLLSTSWRFGVSASFDRLQEYPSSGGADQLWLGNCNLVWQFAQSDRAEFRTGLGMNWIDDPQCSNVGFNFTYAADIFPYKPWIVSAQLDAGTLGRTGLFRFRSTAGVVLRNFEIYTGYEYNDIGRASWNGLIAGLRNLVLSESLTTRFCAPRKRPSNGRVRSETRVEQLGLRQLAPIAAVAYADNGHRTELQGHCPCRRRCGNSSPNFRQPASSTAAARAVIRTSFIQKWHGP